MIEIYLVSISLSDKKKIRIKLIGSYDETPKTYKKNNATYPTPKVIKKEKLLTISSPFLNSISSNKPFFSYKTYCKVGDIEKAKIMLIEKANERLLELKEGLEFAFNTNELEIKELKE